MEVSTDGYTVRIVSPDPLSAPIIHTVICVYVYILTPNVHLSFQWRTYTKRKQQSGDQPCLILKLTG